MITPVSLQNKHIVTFMKSGDSNARKFGLCQKLSRALNHTTAAPKYHQPKQFNQQSKIILNQVKQFQLFFSPLKKRSLCDSIPLLDWRGFYYFMDIEKKARTQC